MPGTLFVVATPIGNLEDITLRALRVLREADLIAAEDTRRTARLLARHAISTPTVSFHQHNTRTALPKLISRLEESKAVALVTDAGTPGISDPGVELVRACIERGIPVEPIPGVSAALTAAVASGFPLIPLTIAGFPPYRSTDRTRWFQALSKIQGTVTFFEAPHRIGATLRTAAETLGDRQIMLGRELTKLHQEFLRGTASQLAEMLATRPKGEFTVVISQIGQQSKQVEARFASDEDIAAEFGHITDLEPISRREAVRATAQRLGIPSRQVYAAIERTKR
ncbi:MAG TPA: 16S rRNA (cytidine(1402)-2'-O)-methyltransferase [Vicinamibacterales bacterium]|jgi:16S rRNA (cytidine1402-2'-O)-methyltransferase|nr:16S rRNA (cytidine(1402)-2'-O)-methyltransferase [Vicinamibacterales bacterium]